MLTTQHNPDIVRELDHARAPAANRLGHTFRDVGRDERGHHAHAKSADESAKVEHPECDGLAAPQPYYALNHAPDDVHDARREEDRLPPKPPREVTRTERPEAFAGHRLSAISDRADEKR